ncbi:hypothetical protein FRC08_002543 [Ceratobasidium sp. 394]|nr:hypothetical protein FRC08_002543 [Ceratobasidium sp. 394]KAG9095043.1 hypothetical protein FS749_011210 [Ceratobasidium sp. UAMH 11750]
MTEGRTRITPQSGFWGVLLAPIARFLPQQLDGMISDILWSLHESSSNRYIPGFIFELHEEQDRDLESALFPIFYTARIYGRILLRRRFVPHTPEARIGVENLLAFAYDVADDERWLMHLIERELRLPRANVPGVEVALVKPDAVHMMLAQPMPAYNYHRDKVSCLYLPAPPEYCQMVHCVAEYGIGAAGKHRALMGITSGLYQRRSVGIYDQFVFGIFQVRLCVFEVIAGIWRDDKIEICKLGEFGLEGTLGCVSFYLLNREIKKLGLEYMERICRQGSIIGPRVGILTKLTDWMPWDPRRDYASDMNEVMVQEEANESEGEDKSVDEEYIETNFEAWGSHERVLGYLETMRSCGTPVPDDPWANEITPSPNCEAKYPATPSLSPDLSGLSWSSRAAGNAPGDNSPPLAHTAS